MAPARSIRRYPVPKLHHALVRRYGLMVLSIVFSLDIKPFEAMTAWDQLPSDSCNLRSGNRLESNIKLQVTDMAIFVIVRLNKHFVDIARIHQIPFDAKIFP